MAKNKNITSHNRKNTDKKDRIKQTYEKPVVNMGFLHLSSKSLTSAIKDYQHQSKEQNKFISTLEQFLYDFNNAESIGTALKTYSSHKSGSYKGPLPDAVVNTINRIHSSDAARRALRLETTHIHIMPDGKGAAVLWGYTEGNVFNVLVVDPTHSTIK